MSVLQKADANRCDRPLGDSPDRSYAGKLERFSRFIEPELQQIFSDLQLPSSGVVLDVGCGTGLATAVLAQNVSDDVTVVGLDLSFPHLRSARLVHDLPLIQADMERSCIKDRSVDLIWCCNAINHTADAEIVLRSLQRCLKHDGRIAMAQSGLLAEMFFAWDAHLDDALRSACHEYYRERYGLSCHATADVRGLIGVLHRAGFDEVESKTYIIERTQPLGSIDREYFQHAIFEGLWGERLRRYIDADIERKLDVYCDTRSPEFWLHRTDFYHLQTLTVCQACVPPEP
jgi:ubiquinone/menaquinone biosynthesis C-methylase UbiE